MQILEDALKQGCEGNNRSYVRDMKISKTFIFYVLKSLGNTGLSASTFTPLLERCVLGPSTTLELRVAAVQAFRRFPCSADVS